MSKTKLKRYRIGAKYEPIEDEHGIFYMVDDVAEIPLSNEWMTRPEIPPKIDPDKEPHLVALRRIADALEMANVTIAGLDSAWLGAHVAAGGALPGCFACKLAAGSAAAVCVHAERARGAKEITYKHVPNKEAT